MDTKSLLNVILAPNGILSNRSRPQKREDPLRGSEVNSGWLEMRGRINKKEVVLVKAKATAGPPQFHDSRKGGSQKVVSIHRIGVGPENDREYGNALSSGRSWHKSGLGNFVSGIHEVEGGEMFSSSLSCLIPYSGNEKGDGANLSSGSL